MEFRRRSYCCPSEACAVKGGQGKSVCHRIGTFTTKWNHQPVPRYECQKCGRRFSSHTFRKTYLQKKPYLNRQIYELYCSGMTQRRIARQLGCNIKTVVRKFIFMAAQAREAHEQMLVEQTGRVTEVQFDEMETFEHTRLKPLSIALAVSGDGKRVLDARVGSLHYKGRLASLALKKYGIRKDTSKKAREDVLRSVARVAASSLKISTDAKPQYADELKATLNGYQHLAFPNRRNQIQHALNPTRRKNVDDPLFWLNHVAARIRHDLSRMMRKVWTTSKRPDRLQAHLFLFIAYFNNYPL